MPTHAGRHVPAALGAQETLHWRAQVVAELRGLEAAKTPITVGHRVADASGEEDRPLLGLEHCNQKMLRRAKQVKALCHPQSPPWRERLSSPPVARDGKAPVTIKAIPPVALECLGPGSSEGLPAVRTDHRQPEGCCERGRARADAGAK